MTPMKTRVGVVFTLLELYRNSHPEMPGTLGAAWQKTVRGLLEPHGVELHFVPVAHTPQETADAVVSCETAECDLLMVLPLAYAASGNARDALVQTRLPLLIVSTARDATLPYDMDVEVILANHAMHGVQDLANVLARAGRRFELVAGAPGEAAFRTKLLRVVRAAAGARVLRKGCVGRIGRPFEGMLDFGYSRRRLEERLGLRVEDSPPERLGGFARAVRDRDAADYAAWAHERFEIGSDLSDEDLLLSARWSLALEQWAEERAYDAVTMNFLAVAQAEAETMPFLGASRLLAHGVGYAGEGDALAAALVAAAARMAGASTFTEMFCPDYARAQVLLSHMGECNYELADPRRPVRLVAKPFPYGACRPPVVPVFQMRPGTATLVSLTEWPAADGHGEGGFRLVAAVGEILSAPEHPRLQSPYSRITFGPDLGGFLEAYSRAGGTHHLALAYGDLREEFRSLAVLCGLDFVAV